MDEKKFDEARQLFARAYALRADTEILGALAAAELKSGLPVEALSHFQQYLLRQDADKVNRTRAENEWLPAAMRATAQLVIYLPAGAEVTIDGALQSRAVPEPGDMSSPPPGTPLTIRVAAGAHEVVEHLGTFEQLKHVFVTGKASKEIHFDPAPADRPAPGFGPSSSPEPSSTHAPPESKVAHASPASKWPWVLGLGAAAAAAAVVGVGFTIGYNVSAREADQLASGLGPSGCANSNAGPGCADLSSAHDAEHRNAALATDFFLGASIGGLVAGATWLLWPSSVAPASDSAQLRLIPTLGQQASGVALAGAW